MSDIKVFVSYSWGVEEKTKVVDEIEALCPPRNIQLIRDRNEMKHGDLIVDFMDNLTGGEHVITVFSKPYFKSKWCMYELLKIWQKGDFQQRTHPIIAGDCDLGDAAYRMDTVEYWVEEHQKIKALLEGCDPSLFVEEFKKLNMLRDISQNVNELMNFAAGRLTTPLADLRAQQYAQILDQIRKVSDVPVVDHHTGQEVMVLDSGQARKIKQLEEQLEIWEEKLHTFKMQLAQTADPDTLFSIQSKIKRQISPEIEKINKQYQTLIRGVDVPEEDATPIIADLVEVVNNEPEGLPNEVKEQLALIRQEIQDQNKSATAKLKVALPIVPGLASYELDLDTENFLGDVWSGIRRLLGKKADAVNPQ